MSFADVPAEVPRNIRTDKLLLKPTFDVVPHMLEIDTRSLLSVALDVASSPVESFPTAAKSVVSRQWVDPAWFHYDNAFYERNLLALKLSQLLPAARALSARKSACRTKKEVIAVVLGHCHQQRIELSAMDNSLLFQRLSGVSNSNRTVCIETESLAESVSSWVTMCTLACSCADCTKRGCV
ncbi:hypothetical protein P692DRAFT_20881130 [Suillus brevipes Sb2]|nr:hypothetical protein P692DRAFT_20881130 [Suillus brevipes Sb2]